MECVSVSKANKFPIRWPIQLLMSEYINRNRYFVTALYK